MGAYMYPIIVKREPQIVHYQKEVELESGVLTLAELRKHVSETETFSITEIEASMFYFKTTLTVYGSRPETKKEVSTRVKREELYMENYNKFHSKNK